MTALEEDPFFTQYSDKLIQDFFLPPKGGEYSLLCLKKKLSLLGEEKVREVGIEKVRESYTYKHFLYLKKKFLKEIA